MNRPWPALGIGWLLALIVLILDIVFWAVGHIPSTEALLFGLLALALLL